MAAVGIQERKKRWRQRHKKNTGPWEENVVEDHGDGGKWCDSDSSRNVGGW